MKSTRRLYLEQLEERCTPTTYNNPWPDPRHLTLSFVPDGTVIGTHQSQLFQLLNPQFSGGSTAWEMAILTAFQTWAVNANINVGVVADGGQPLGAPGVIQGDSRFGDIRVAAFPQGPTAGDLAMEQPFDPSAGTLAGDFILNGSYGYNGQQAGSYDLYSVALHEAGHVFGLPDVNDPTSVMDDTYNGVRTGPSAADIAALQALYGARQPDAFEGSSGNNSFATASPLQPVNGGSSFPAEADITTTSDKDFYKVNIPLLDGPLTVQLLTSGLSLFQGRLTVYDAHQNVIGSATASDPLHGDVSVHLNGTLLGATYYIKVESASNSVFGIGGYRLDVRPDSLLSLGNLVGSVVNLLDMANHTLSSALGLPQTVSQTNSRFDYEYYARLHTSSEVDYYSFRAPTPPAGTSNVLTVMVWGLQNGGLDPLATVYDAQGHPVAANVLTHENGTYVIQVPNASANALYYVGIGAYTPGGTRSTGNYFFGADFGTVATTPDTLITNNPAAPGAQSFNTSTSAQPQLSLTANHDAVFHLLLTVSSNQAPAGAAVEMDILDQNNNLVYSQVTPPGAAQSVTVYLSQGSYMIRFKALNTGTSGMAPLLFTLQGIDLSDSQSPYQYNPTGGSGGSGGSGGNGSTTYSSGAYSTSVW